MPVLVVYGGCFLQICIKIHAFFQCFTDFNHCLEDLLEHVLLGAVMHLIL